MFWTSIPNDERLILWKNLRDSVKDATIDHTLSEVAKFCATMPVGSRTLDYYSTSDWPGPWEILYHGSFCTSSISLIMYHTLVLHDKDIDIRLELIEDSYGIYLIPVVNNQYVLNYELGHVSLYKEIQDRFKLLQIFNKEQIKPLK